jgi:hypothetical protein
MYTGNGINHLTCHAHGLSKYQIPVEGSLVSRYKSRLVLSDWSSPVLSDWSTPAMGAPPRADKPEKPLIGNGEHLAAVGQH